MKAYYSSSKNENDVNNFKLLLTETIFLNIFGQIHGKNSNILGDCNIVNMQGNL